MPTGEVQSADPEIRLWPALPDGSVKGLFARGSLQVSMEWNDKTLKKLSIFARGSGPVTLYCGNEKMGVAIKKGQSMEWSR